MLILILTLIVFMNSLYLIRLISDLIKHKQELFQNSDNKIFLAISSMLIFFLSTLGISDFATSTVVYRLRKLVSDKNLPGTLNTQCVIPVAVMALTFMSLIKVDLSTLTICIIAQVLGSYLGPDLVAKLSATTVRWIVGIGLLLTASFILASQLSLISTGGVASELHGWKLLFAAGFMFIFGVLNNIGIGSYPLAMATLYSLGMSPASAFPIMMGASTLSTPISSLKIIKYGQYNRKITISASIFGIIGVLAGVFLIRALDLSQLKYILIVVLFYTGVSMIYKELKS